MICFMYNVMNFYKRIGIFGINHYNLSTYLIIFNPILLREHSHMTSGFWVGRYTANVLTIKIMDFDHVPNPGIMSP